MAREQGEKNDDDKYDSEGNSTSDSSDSDINSKNKDKDSIDSSSDEELLKEGENEEAREENRQLGRDLIKESEWQRERQIRCQTVRDTQREEDKTLPMLEFVPLYQQSAEKKSKDNGGKTMAKSKSGIEKVMRVDKIIREVFKKTKANISVGFLLETTPYCKKNSWLHYMRMKRIIGWGPLILIT